MDSSQNKGEEGCFHWSWDDHYSRGDNWTERADRGWLNRYEERAGQCDRGWNSRSDSRPQEHSEVTATEASSKTTKPAAKIVAIIPIYREVGKLGKVLGRFESGL